MNASRHPSPRPQHPLRIAVIGARGIGKHHAKWFHLEGCDIVAFAGADPDQVAATTAALHLLFRFSGRGYADTREMLRREKPDVVVVASPHAFHLEHVRLALDRGAHVYVEKPFAWDEARPVSRWLAESRAILDVARESGLLIGINTQYACAWDAYLRFVGAPDRLEPSQRSLSVEIETENVRSDRKFERIWVDVGSHPISILLKVLPDGRVVEESADIRFGEKETVARFDFVDGAGGTIHAMFRCGSIVGGPPKRLFGLDELLVGYNARHDDGGILRAILQRDGREETFTDFMHEAIRRFVRAVDSRSSADMAATGEDGVRNLEIQAQLASLGHRLNR